MLKFNAWGWIIAHEDKGLEGSKTMRFDDKSSALAWVKEDEVHRWIDTECLILNKN
mgnify:FL=1